MRARSWPRPPNGKVVRIGRPQGNGVEPGDVVAILNGPAAGRWRRVLHVLDPTTFLLDKAVPKGSDTVSICQAFVSQVYEENRIDIRGGSHSDSFVLAGNHFGTRVVRNHVLGGGLGWRMLACPSENPVRWAWSYAPFMGGSSRGTSWRIARKAASWVSSTRSGVGRTRGGLT